jgi:hypothetical protein
MTRRPRPPPFRWLSGEGAATIFLIAGGAVLLGYLFGCTTPTPTEQRIIDITCDSDAVLQPTLVQIVIAPVPGANVADNLLVHPAVVEACAIYHSKPIAAVVEPTTPVPVVQPQH